MNGILRFVSFIHLHHPAQPCERREEDPEKVVDIEEEIEGEQNEDEDENYFVEVNRVARAFVPRTVHLANYSSETAIPRDLRPGKKVDLTGNHAKRMPKAGWGQVKMQGRRVCEGGRRRRRRWRRQ